MYGEGVETMSQQLRRRSRRIELRTTPEERSLLDHAVAVMGVALTEFVVDNACEAARRVLADRQQFEVDELALIAWEALNQRPARDLPGLRKLMQRPTPFVR